MAAAASIPPARDIPLTFTASLKSWSVARYHSRHSTHPAQVARRREARCRRRGAPSKVNRLPILPPATDPPSRRLPFFVPAMMPASASGDSLVIARTERVNLTTPKHYLNMLSIKSQSPSPGAPPPAVVLHGYGAGMGFFFPNYPTLATWAGHRGTDIYALDWLGMGRSARVPFHVKSKRDDIAGRVHEAESFFINSLEDWRDKMGLEKMTLIGHSLGAYFSVAYALRYPTRVHKLILLSPAGVPHDPNNLTEASRELTDTADASSFDSAPAVPSGPSQVSRIRSEQRANRQESRVSKVITYLWEEGWSPFQIVRSTLFWGPMLVGKVQSFAAILSARANFLLVLEPSLSCTRRGRSTRPT